ncbi:hypothetical protein ACTMU2_04840 [Cupriavidus basilensis]
MTDTGERYVFRPGILRSFGWRVLDIPGKDWLDDQDAVLGRIEAMLADGEDRALDTEVEMAAPLAQPAAVPATAATGERRATAIASGMQEEFARTLHFEQGTSRKFWRASCCAGGAFRHVWPHRQCGAGPA